MLEETDWIGGQLTGPGRVRLDEHEHIERFGGTASYYQLRNALRDHTALRQRCRQGAAFQPGNCWVTRVAFEPRVAVDAMMGPLMRPHSGGGRAVGFHVRLEKRQPDRVGASGTSVRAGLARRAADSEPGP